MKRMIRIDVVRVTGLERTGAIALPGRLEAAVRRALDRAPDSLPQERDDVARMRVRVDGGAVFGPDDVGAAVAAAIARAGSERGAER